MPLLSGNIVNEFISTLLLVLGSLSAFVITLPYLKYLNNGKNLKKHTIICLSILGIIFIYVLIGILSSFGPAWLFCDQFLQMALQPLFAVGLLG